MAARDPIGRFISGGLLQAAVLACLASALAPQSSAIAAPPSVTISSPANGAVGNDQTPTFAGVADVEAGTVTLRIYAGTSAEGTVLQKLGTGLFPEGAWSVRLKTDLGDGVYTAQASQTNAAMQTGSSPPVTFTVDTAAPIVSLDPPEPAPGVTAPDFTGGASDTRPVTVEIFAGPEETLVSTAAAAGTGARWRSSDASPPLAVGQYTAIAFQESSLTGNPEGRSQGVPFAIRSAPPLPPGFLATTNGTVALAAKPIEPPHAPSLMAPFPVVRIAWAQDRTGITLRLLRVQQTPAGAQVRVRCTGRGCPWQGLRRTTVPSLRGVEPVTFRSLQRHLGFGAVLQLFVSKPGQIGKYTRFTVRRGRLPERVDTCLDPAGVRPLACPS